MLEAIKNAPTKDKVMVVVGLVGTVVGSFGMGFFGRALYDQKKAAKVEDVVEVKED